MVLVLAVLVGLVLGRLLGGRVAALAAIPIRAPWLFYAAIGLQIAGYPLGLAGEEIPLGSRIILVADAFDAMTSDRCYRAAGTASAAIVELRKRCWTQFDARVVAALERLQAEEPDIADVRAAG